MDDLNLNKEENLNNTTPTSEDNAPDEKYKNVEVFDMNNPMNIPVESEHTEVANESTDSQYEEITDNEKLPDKLLENVAQSTQDKKDDFFAGLTDDNGFEEVNTNDTVQESYGVYSPDNDYDEDDSNLSYTESDYSRASKVGTVLLSAALCFIAFMFGILGGYLSFNMALKNQTGMSFDAHSYVLTPTTIADKYVSDLQDVSDIVENTMPSIVSITSTISINYDFGFGLGEQSYTTPASGSGVIYAKADDCIFIVTNYHVVENATNIKITWIDGTASAAEVQGYSSDNDIALLRVNLSAITDETMEQLRVAVIGDSDKIKIGEGAIAIGNALGYGQTVTDGIISALDRQVFFEDGGTMKMIQTNAAINPGNSGGALLNAKGELIGINSAKYSDVDIEGIGYSIPVNLVVQTVNDIMSGKIEEEVGVVLGISGFTVDEDMSKKSNMPCGVYVQYVEANSPAEQCGLKTGDIIYSIDKIEIKTIEELQDYLATLHKKTVVSVKLYRPYKDSYDTAEFMVFFE